MDPKKMKTLSDLFGHDLTGWKITQCHFLELKHESMRRFPAVDEHGEVVAMLDKPSLEKVWKQLEPRQAQVTSLNVIAHLESGVAFNLENGWLGDGTPLHIFSDKDIELLCQKNMVHWAPGLIQVHDSPVIYPVFT